MIVNCSYCNTEIERERKNKLNSCFNCKRMRNIRYHEERNKINFKDRKEDKYYNYPNNLDK